MNDGTATEAARAADEAQAGALSTALTEFWSGLTTTTMSSWLLAVALAGAEFTLCCVMFTPSRLIAMNPRFIRANAGDEYCNVSLALLKYRQATLTGLQVAYMGASQATRAIDVHDPGPAISAAISERTGVRVEFQRFSSNTQRLEEALLITDQFPPSFRGVAMFVVTDYQSDYKPWRPVKQQILEEEQRAERLLSVDAPSLPPIWAKHHYRPRRTGIYFVDHLRFFAARRVAWMPPLPQSARRSVDPMNDPNRVARAERRIENMSSVFLRRAPLLTAGRETLDTILRNLKRRGIVAVLLEAPNNPIRDRADSEGHIAEYRRQLTMYAEAHDALYWNFNDELHLRAEDFQDSVHLGSPSGRARFQGMLVDRVSELIKERFPNEAESEPRAPEARAVQADPPPPEEEDAEDEANAP